jgi:uncharacterized protein YbjT (DUF2867 family)
MKNAPVIAVFGATGAQGGGLARAILADPKRAFRVRAITRRPESPAAHALAQAGAQIVAADLDDPPSVRRALEGAQGAFCVTDAFEHGSPERELAQAEAMAEAVARASVAHVVWSTLEDTRDFVALGGGAMPVLDGRYNVPHFDAKGEANRFFVDRRVPTTLLYTSFQWDNLIRYGMAPRRNGDGRLVFPLPLGNRRLPGIAAEDIGRCAFAIFARGEALVGKAIGIAGEHLTGEQMAEQLGLALGEPVRYEAVAPAQVRAPDAVRAGQFAAMFRFVHDFERVHCDARSVACARELNPRLQTFAAWLAAHRHRIPRH